jgi:hypothetical protein
VCLALNRRGKDTERRRLPKPTIAEEAESEKDRVTSEFVRGRPMEGIVAWEQQRKPRNAMWEQRPVTARLVSPRVGPAGRGMRIPDSKATSIMPEES